MNNENPTIELRPAYRLDPDKIKTPDDALVILKALAPEITIEGYAADEIYKGLRKYAAGHDQVGRRVAKRRRFWMWIEDIATDAWHAVFGR